MSALAKASAAWGKSLPGWVKTLAEACDAASLRKVAARLDVSPASVSLALNGKRNKLSFIKARTESILMSATVSCPVLGNLEINKCLRDQARPFILANPLRVRLYRACRNGCPHYENKEKTA